MNRRGNRPPRIVEHDWHVVAAVITTLVALAVVILALAGIWVART